MPYVCGLCDDTCVGYCGTICSDNCTKGCSGGCSGCGDDCSSGCGDSCSNNCKNNCGGSCDTACNTTCNGAAQDVNYETIKTLKRKYTEKDISNLSAFIINEAKRRGATPINVNFVQKGKIDPDEINKIVDNLKLSNYTTTKVTSKTRGLYDWLIDLKDKAIQAYESVVPIS